MKPLKDLVCTKCGKPAWVRLNFNLEKEPLCEKHYKREDEIAAMKGEDHADRCAQSRRLKETLKERDEQLAASRAEVEAWVKQCRVYEERELNHNKEVENEECLCELVEEHTIQINPLCPHHASRRIRNNN